MTDTKHLWPRPGLKLRRDDTMAIIPEEGAELPLNTLTYRRLAAGELLERDPRPKVREAFPDTTPPADGLMLATAEEPAKDDAARGRKSRERFEKEG